MGYGKEKWKGEESKDTQSDSVSLVQCTSCAVVDSEPAAGFMKFRSIQFNLHKFKKKINCLTPRAAETAEEKERRLNKRSLELVHEEPFFSKAACSS